LLEALGDVQTSDRDLQFGLRALARELRKHAKAGAPWRARAGLDVLAPLDLPAWAALTALFAECPVMLANVSAPHDKRPHALDPSAFQFIAESAKRFGSQCIVVNIDPKRVKSQRSGESEVWEVHINGGRIPTGLEAVAWAKKVEELGAGEIVLTSMDCDGTKDGYDLEITRAVSEAVGIPVVASGGAGRPEHLADAILLGKADAALAASIFHFGEYTIRQTKQIMAARGIPVRL
jgi:NAD(P)H-dependent flavin oxidoreductase YrpB (nitropropane dioxygenase family)